MEERTQVSLFALLALRTLRGSKVVHKFLLRSKVAALLLLLLRLLGLLLLVNLLLLLVSLP